MDENKKVPSLDNIFTVNDFFPKDLDGNRKNADSKNAKNKKNSWEKIKPSASFKDNFQIDDLRKSSPSRSNTVYGEHNNGGTGTLVTEKPSKPKYDFSDSIIKDSQERKELRENRHKKPIESRDEWEVVSKAKTTADVSSSNMGFTPNKSSFSMKEIPKVKIGVIEKQKESSQASIRAGIEAAKIKTENDAILKEAMEGKMKGVWSWEKEAHNEMLDRISKPVVPESPFEFSNDSTSTCKQKDYAVNLDGIFNNNIPHYEEIKTKKDMPAIRESRKRRQDDRSWEKVEIKKLGKF